MKPKEAASHLSPSHDMSNMPPNPYPPAGFSSESSVEFAIEIEVSASRFSIKNQSHPHSKIKIQQILCKKRPTLLRSCSLLALAFACVFWSVNREESLFFFVPVRFWKTAWTKEVSHLVVHRQMPVH